MIKGCFIFMLLTLCRVSAGNDADLWAKLKEPGVFVLMRHAPAPGTGDPADFDLNDCATQRTLSDAGRKQARATGDRFREAGIKTAKLYTSQWCRCRETAALLGLGEAVDLAALNSFFQQPRKREAQMRDLRDWLAENLEEGPVVLVTHQVVITALTGVFPASGEMVLVRRAADGEMEVLGRILAK